MKFPLSWIYDFVDIRDISSEEFRHRMTMSGTMIEAITELGAGIKGVVLGRIASVEKHPDADKLVVCQVDVGAATGRLPSKDNIQLPTTNCQLSTAVQIVTGAPGVQPGQIVPVCLDGAELPSGLKIKSGSLRGVQSHGMMCGEDELFPDRPKAESLMFLPESTLEKFPLGTDIKDVLGLNEVIVEVELTANRPDCYSIIGIAREVAAVFGKPFNSPPSEGWTPKADGVVSVKIQNPALCPRYTACKVDDLNITPSPEWMQRRLQNSGIRPINNIVDITNYVMLEFGQPLHAFDSSAVAGDEIIVRNAKTGEKITTLDEIERELTPNDLIIADSQKPIAIAGVMGGLDSGITDSTTSIIFESANFNGVSVRKTSKRLNLPSESSGHFIKGIDENITLAAINRACALIGGDAHIAPHVDAYPNPRAPHKVEFSAEKINKFLGTQIEEEEMIKILNSVNIEVNGDNATIPTYRADITSWEDLSEEIARFHGYDNIESATLQGVADGGYTKEQILENKAKELLTAQGANEILTYSFISPRDYERAEIALGDAIKIRNPIGEDTSIMRTTAIPSMLVALHNNARLGNSAVLLFELATVYSGLGIQDSGFSERKVLVIGGYGSCDFYDIKGFIENLFDELGVKYSIKALQKAPAYLHDYQSAEIFIRGKTQGKIGRIHPQISKNYDIKGKAYIAEIEWDAILESANLDKRYAEIPRFPSMQRDIALLADSNITVGEIEETIWKVKSNILESVKLFDIYEGEQVERGKKSIAFSLTYRDKEKTLTEEEVNNVMTQILENLQKKLNVTLRTS
ncbi:MAG: phenylalanine--tRNA ligase subunit beta [Oscillospiraceae bacterium]|nr:phenylalanine--tRNA ligase subunit beta [Oscillospiraceae bacterium]